MATESLWLGIGHPGLLLMLAGVLCLALPRTMRGVVSVVAPLVGIVLLWQMPAELSITRIWMGFELIPVHLDRLSFLFSLIFLIAAGAGLLYAWAEGERRVQASGLIYAGGAIAAVLAGDLLTLFLFWEATAIASAFIVWHRHTPEQDPAVPVLRYLIIQILSGLLLLAGTAQYYLATGSLAFGHFGLEAPGGLLILLAFGMKCAFPLLHNWLQDAYPRASAAGTVLLSAFTTKLAVYALARGYAGTECLMWIGAIMTLFPIFFAVLENDLRKVLAYSLNNQLGFMVAGIGIGTQLALDGAAAHAFAHILYKALLFMAMGAVVYRVGHCRASDLGGLYRSMPWTARFCIIASASISAFPLFSGFVTKSMILSAAAYEGHAVLWIALLFASAGVMDHSGIKVPFFSFFAHDSGLRVQEAPRSMLLAMAIVAFLCIAIGVYPDPLYALLPHQSDYHPYTGDHVVTQLQLLMFAALAFVTLMRTGLYPPEIRGINLDTDWLYRRGLDAPARWVVSVVSEFNAWRGALAGRVVARVNGWASDVFSEEGLLTRTTPVAFTTLALIWLLGLLLLNQGH